jgi:hypothetical protein
MRPRPAPGLMPVERCVALLARVADTDLVVRGRLPGARPRWPPAARPGNRLSRVSPLPPARWPAGRKPPLQRRRLPGGPDLPG